jgi:hypothetical protein
MLGKRGVQVVESRCVVLQFCIVIKSCLLLRVVQKTKIAGRNDAAIAAALEAVGQQPNSNPGANAEVRMLETFLRNHPYFQRKV